MAAQDVSIRELVDKVSRGDIRLPELQRGVVWEATKVRNLFDSLYRGYPSGTILTWETDEPVETREFGVEQDTEGSDRYQLLLDGQQRLTSLSAVLRGLPITVKGRKRPITLLFNLDHPDHAAEQVEIPEDESVDDDADIDQEEESDPDSNSMETFALRTNKLAAQSSWVPVTEALESSSDAAILRKANVTSLDDPKYDLYSARLERLRDIVKYQYRVDVLDRSKTYEEVTDIFVRVNSSGTILRGSDLALAQITARWRGSLALFMEFAETMSVRGYDFDMAIYLKTLVSFATGQSRFRHIGRASTDDLKTGWARAVQGIEFATNFLRSNMDIDSPILLSSHFIVVALAAYGDHHDYNIAPSEGQKLRTWALAASAKGRFSGASETFLDQDIQAIRAGRAADGLLQLLRAQFGRLEIEPIELQGASARSPLYRSMFLAFRDAKAKDWDDGVVISVNHSGAKHRIESHHVFPQDLLEGKRPKSEIDDVSNLAFVSSRKNKRLGTTPPEQYLGDVDPELLEAQGIPIDPSLWPESRYLDFLEERRQLVAKRLNEFVGVPL